MFFVSFEDLGTVEMYETVKRSDPRVPKMLKSFDVGPLPQFVLPNKSCQLLAVGNANRGKGLDSGSITFIRKPLSDASQVMRVPIDEMDDAYLVKKGLNMPLSFSSLEYWDEYGPDAEELDFSEIRANYKSSIFLEPKAMAWSGPNEEELLVNLQENNGLMRIDAATGKPLSVASYGLKDHSEVPVDINAGDKKCALSTYDSLFAMRNPDIITTVRYNNKTYVITANEGDSKEYNGFEEKWKAKSLFKVSSCSESLTSTSQEDTSSHNTVSFRYTGKQVCTTECDCTRKVSHRQH